MKKQREIGGKTIRAESMKHSEADKLRVVSSLSGMVVGSLLGVPISIALGLLRGPGEGPSPGDAVGWLVEGFSFFRFTILFACLIAFVVSIYLWKRKGKINSGNCILSSLTVLFILVYVNLTMAFIFAPLNAFLLKYHNPFGVFWIGALVFFPFMLLAAYILFPSVRPRMRHNLRMIFTRRYWKKAWKNPKSRRKIIIFLIATGIIAIHEVWRIMLG